VPSLAIKDAQIDDELVRANERMLTDGFYAEVTLEYDPVLASEVALRWLEGKAQSRVIVVPGKLVNLVP